MKRGLLILTALGLGLGFWVMAPFPDKKPVTEKPSIVPPVEKSKESNPSTLTSSIFIPYWNIPKNTSEVSSYHTSYYFGIAPTSEGDITNDQGFQNIGKYIDHTPSRQKRYLTVRMLDADINTSILEDESAQRRLIHETLNIVDRYEFDGVVLDLEVSALPFDSVEESITKFVTYISQEVRGEDKALLMTIFGDTFYRGRPYNIDAINPLVDGFLIMAYDFHKSRGEPGPNFPFDRRSLDEGGFNYDFKQMIADYKAAVPAEQLTVIFGMYGYDWTLGPQGKPLKAAQAISLYEVEEAYGHLITPNPLTKEKHVRYTDDEGYVHELWYEDHESVEEKKEYLEEQGIGSTGYWVWGYF